ncbi:Fe-S cluster assembly sulfur transfer protein SufU [Oceanivirga salmonicida]|uniref:Fe-S cluster assembly sulfur transfer protein SufU n=1 Tax=Oceanivirga salmonicida TaxID=1769291 RepID=UPI0012E21C5F|nr:SUF system NifU family Fe-S cluster assembly protein [Oceanivirga salmonicida]
MNLEKIYSQTILDYNSRKDLKREIENPTLVERGHNPSCGDDILVLLKLDNDKIVDASFTGNSCAISTASTAMLIENIKGKTKQKALEIINDFFEMMRTKYDGNEELLNDAVLLKFVSNMPARIKCATLAWHTLKVMLEK